MEWNALNIHKQYACRCLSLLDSVFMFCHMCSSAYVLCVYVCVCDTMCVYCMCMYMCVCMCVCMQVLCSRMVKVHLHNVYWYTCIRVREPSIMAYSV